MIADRPAHSASCLPLSSFHSIHSIFLFVVVVVSPKMANFPSSSDIPKSKFTNNSDSSSVL